MMHGGVLIRQLAGLFVDDLGTWHCGLDAVEQRVGVSLGGGAAVVTIEHAGVIGVGTYHGDGLDRFGERQHTVVVQKHHRLSGGLCGQGIVALAADDLRT